MKIPLFVSSISSFVYRLFTSIRPWEFRKIIVIFCLVFLCSCQSPAQKNSGVIHLTLWQGINPPTNRDVFEHLVDKFNVARKSPPSAYSQGGDE
ncbi:MAG: hypothetical protein ACFKPT_11780 [Gloeotrichia echinulata GP01]